MMMLTRNPARTLALLSALTALVSVIIGHFLDDLVAERVWTFASVLGMLCTAALSHWQPRVPNPWSMQRDLMSRSQQRLPPTPSIVPGTVLYLALIMEELRETIDVVTDELRACMRYDARMAPDAPRWPMDTPGLASTVRNLETVADTMRWASPTLRQDVSTLPTYFTAKPSREGAIGLLDGVTDLAVVVCGLAESSGLPGAAAYIEVQQSNLSKCNEVTGLIDKDATGKWIKGPGYVEPNLGAVIDAHRARAYE